jgi:RHS repeat-associated protein
LWVATSTQFTYDGLGRRVGIRQLLDGTEVSNRRFLWCDSDICEERTQDGAVAKRYFIQGMKIENGPAAGMFFYTRDHLGSVRELTDSTGTVRARYTYDPFGRRTRLIITDLDTDFGFAGMFFSKESSLNLTRFRAYDPNIGCWLSRDPLNWAELEESPNLFAYVENDPLNHIDPFGLSCDAEKLSLAADIAGGEIACAKAVDSDPLALALCLIATVKAIADGIKLDECLSKIHDTSPPQPKRGACSPPDPPWRIPVTCFKAPNGVVYCSEVH